MGLDHGSGRIEGWASRSKREAGGRGAVRDEGVSLPNGDFAGTEAVVKQWHKGPVVVGGPAAMLNPSAFEGVAEVRSECSLFGEQERRES